MSSLEWTSRATAPERDEGGAVTAYDELDRYVDDHMAAWTAELIELCSIGSEAADRAALQGAADWTAARLRRVGAAVDLVELDGVPPLVVGDVGSGPILNAVQHYDVQPAVPLDLWATGPYDPEVRDGRLYARGAADNKGELMARIWAVEAYRAAIGELPCRVRFLIEGEEESGSEHFGRLLDQRTGLREAAGALIEGGGIDLRGRPQVVGGTRGMVGSELVCRTIRYDAHSSLSNLLPSAAIRMVKALATFWDSDGNPIVPGLRDGVLPPTRAQLDVLAAIPDDAIDDLRGVFGIDRFLGGRSGQEAIRALTLEPTCNLQSIWSGYTGPGGKTITPAEAHARLDLRLVPDQEPDRVIAAVRAHLDAQGFGDIEVRPFSFQYRAYWTPPDHPILAAAIRVSEEVLGKPAIHDLSAPGTAPMHVVCASGNVPVTSLGGSDDECRAHAPDERFRLDYAAAAVRMTGRFFDAFATLGD
jgi:acetylornithine deacetylase/succinyl-diaminopimelate desuccinylase-like protein